MMPPVYSLHNRRSPLTDAWEPIYSHQTDRAVCIALTVREAHCNSRGFAHGGLISSLADNSMGLSVLKVASSMADIPKSSAVTVSLALDFIGVAKIGDCLEFLPDVLKVGRTLAFVECRVICGDQLLARANGTFRMV